MVLEVPVRCFVLDTPLDVAHHLNLVRMNQSEGRQRRVPDVAYHTYNKNFEQPTKAEGFSEIIRVPFLPKFDSDRDRELFEQWTT